MKLKSTDIHILKILLSNNQITLDEIKNIYDETDKNIKSSLNRLNSFLDKFNYGKIMKENDMYFFHLQDNIKLNKATALPFFISPEERINYLLFLLSFEKKINTIEIAKYLNITRNTLASDIKILKNKISVENLTLKSVPWKGIYLDGNYKDIYIFSIKNMIKFLVDKESNKFIYKLYDNIINPALKEYYRRFISKDLDEEFSKLSIDILKHFNLEMDLYGVNTLKAIFIYLYQNNNNMDFKNSEIFFETYKKAKELYFDVYNSLISSELLVNKVFILENIEFLILSIITLQKKYLALEIQENTPIILRDIEKIFNIKFKLKEKIEFINILNVLNFNFHYEIHNYHKTPKNRLKFPDFLIEILKELTQKYNYKILKQDFYVLAHFLYDIIFIAHINNLKNKKILIFDYSNNNWVGNNIKNKLTNFFNFKNVDVLSSHMVNFFDCKIFSEYEFIISSSYSDDLNTLIRFCNIDEEKILILDYLDYFEVSSLINKLIFYKYLKLE
ncbi:hypothetical protein H5J22_10105 [Cetobacterium sp. 8H]|uniref:helix-turn-helix domain-containing protein n=1 Tax=Cetobacterium sp. 8H TaxID=2759681 RepID=UPI00163C13F4|nr:helix-turn-helix domain-containing protein [Cetobacterium sp. 8H]MBC2851746.1 hypothetical protein [Cetobacterium sp. 8H]